LLLLKQGGCGAPRLHHWNHETRSLLVQGLPSTGLHDHQRCPKTRPSLNQAGPNCQLHRSAALERRAICYKLLNFRALRVARKHTSEETARRSNGTRRLRIVHQKFHTETRTHETYQNIIVYAFTYKSGTRLRAKVGHRTAATSSLWLSLQQSGPGRTSNETSLGNKYVQQPG
jgi:hypothetical protein